MWSLSVYLSLSLSVWKAETSDIHSLTNKSKPSCTWVLENFGLWPSLQWVPFFALSPKLSFALDLTTWNRIRLSEMRGMSSVGDQPGPLALAVLTHWMLLQPHWEAEGRGFYWSWIEQWGKTGGGWGRRSPGSRGGHSIFSPIAFIFGSASDLSPTPSSDPPKPALAQPRVSRQDATASVGLISCPE